MAAFSTGADWSFPADLPGSFNNAQDDTTDSSFSTSDFGTPSPKPHETPEPAPSEPPPKRRRTHYPPRQCRICLEVVQPTFHQPAESSLPASFQAPAEPRVTYESEDGGRLLSPCKCKGSQKYVHEECLGAWRKADPMQKRNYWECPTCRYRYRLQRLTWSGWISSTAAQLSLTLFIFISAIFVLGFVADPIIALYVDPVHTIANVGSSQAGSLIWEDEPVTWYEHMAKGMASLGLLGFAKFLFSLSPFHWFQTRGTGWGRAAVGGTGRDRLNQLSWITIAIGIATFLFAVWKGVRAWSRRTLESAGERVLDVPGAAEDDDEGD